MRNDMRRWIAALALAFLIAVSIACGPGPDGTEQRAAAETPAAPQAARASELSGPVREGLRSTLQVYEQCRVELAGDRTERLADVGSRLAESLVATLAEVPAARPEVRGRIEEAIRGAEAIMRTAELGAARDAFAEVSRALIALAMVDPAWTEGWHAFSCPMVDGFNKWIQADPKIENPFMGPAMPACGVPADWQVSEPGAQSMRPSGDHHVHRADDIAYYTCSMHPSVRRQEPGACPICSMALTPVTREELETGVIRVDGQRRQKIGVRTAPVEARAIRVRVRALGHVVYDERRLVDVSLRNRGWIGTLRVNETGQRVEKGETLFTLYSPELYAAQEELLTALASQRAARGSSAPERADYLVQAARKRLRLWDVEEWQIDRLAETGEPLEHLPIVSPVTGYVVQKNVVEGAAFEAGARLYRIAGLDRVWIDAEVYEAELPLVEIGQRARVDLSYLPGRSFDGRVSFVYPYLEAGSRTGRIRVELDNPALELKPDMFANVELEIDRGQRLVVPAEAVLYAGRRRLVFTDLGQGRLLPREVDLGVRSGDDYEVLSGLSAGESVVTSGNFLIAAESRLKSAAEMW